jgi:exonuclease SbcC
MRPLELTIEGLRSFRQPVTIDFADRELVAIIGDTGAGKSSILEALTWALYGNATWTKHASVLIGDGCPHMRVRLLFQADGNRWQVTRALKRRQDGTPGPTNAELVCVDGDRPAADSVRQVNPAVERLLGLDWEAFTRTVVLPQGQFARLLTEGDVDRMRILAQIWRTDELVEARGQADEAHRELDAHLEYLRGRRQGYPADVAGELATSRKAATDAAKAAREVDEAVRQVGRCQQAAEQARLRVSAIRNGATQVRETLAGDVAAEASQVVSTAAALDKQLSALDQRIRKQERRVKGLERPEDDGDPDRETTQSAVMTLDSVATSFRDLADHIRRIDSLRAEAKEKQDEATRLKEEADEAETRRRRADEEVARWQRVDAAATAAHGLHPGDDCPVCARALPDGWEAPDSSGLEVAIEWQHATRGEAQQARDRHREKATEASETVKQAEQEAARLGRKLKATAASVAMLPEPFRPALPQPFTADAVRQDDLTKAILADARAAAVARHKKFVAREAELGTARDELHNLREEHMDLRSRKLNEVTEPATRMRTRLERICERVRGCEEVGVELPLVGPQLGDALEQLAEDALAVAEVAEAAMEAAESAAQEAEDEAAKQEANLARLLAAAKVGSVEALADQHVQLRADATQAGNRLEELERMAPIVAALDRHLAEGATVLGTLTDLKTVLQDGRFIRWLTLRRSRALLAVASTLLDKMTGSRYAFADITDEHDEWRIFDTETGYARSPRTLSGGESFVASLALALAMVEMVTRSGGRLEALFLDEGFGALDPENLDAAIDALELSATRGRMVAVISHVQAVAERLTDVLAVERAPSGSQASWLDSAEREAVAAAEAAASVRNLVI